MHTFALVISRPQKGLKRKSRNHPPLPVFVILTDFGGFFFVPYTQKSPLAAFLHAGDMCYP